MKPTNDESRGPDGGDAASKINSRKSNSSIADPEQKSNCAVARSLSESDLISRKQAHRIVRAVARRFDEAWLLAIAPNTGPLSQELCIEPNTGPFGTAEEHCGLVYVNHATIILGTLLSAVALAILPEPRSRAEAMSWKDRFFELRGALLSIARRVLRPAERLDDREIEACWLHSRCGVTP